MLTPRLMVTIKNRPGPSCPGERRQEDLPTYPWKRCCNWVLILLAVLAGCMPAGPRALLDGKRSLEERKFQRAAEQLKNAVSLMPTNAQAWNYLGLAFHHGGASGEAEKAYQRALVLDHDLFEAHYNLGCLYLEQDKTNAARNELTAFTLRRTSSVDGWQKLGLAQLRCRELMAAERSFSEASRLNPHSAAALNGLGLTRMARNRPDEAAKQFHRALKEQPQFRPALLNLAIVSHQYLKNPQFALQKYHEYTALKPPPPDAQAVRQLMVRLQQELNPPRPILTNAATLPATNAAPKTPSNQPLRNFTTTGTELATNGPRPIPVIPTPRLQPPPTNTPSETVKLAEEPVFQPAGDVQLTAPVQPAIQDTQPDTVLTSTPPVKVVDAGTGKRGFLQRVNPLNVFRGNEKAVPSPTPLPIEADSSVAVPRGQGGGEDSESADIPARDTVGRYHYLSPKKPGSGNRKEAERHFQTGVESQQAKRLSEAVESYQAAIKIDPAFFEAHYNLGLAATALGKMPIAWQAYETALVLRPDSTDARYNFALTLKGNYPVDAEKELEILLSNAPNEARAHLALANLYAQQLNQPARARGHYLKVLEIDSRHPQAGAIRFWLAATPP